MWCCHMVTSCQPPPTAVAGPYDATVESPHTALLVRAYVAGQVLCVLSVRCGLQVREITP